MAAPSDNSFVGGMQGGFLLQNNESVTGGVVYAISLPQKNASPQLCSSGAAPVTGQVSGQAVTLSVVAGPQTFNLTGTLSADGSTMMGTYTSSDGAVDMQGSKCGTAQTGLSWSAISVPSVTGSYQGSFHSGSANSGAPLLLAGQDFQVTGALTQGNNIGASSATVTGVLNFQNYPCLTTAYVTGEISGNSVSLQVFASNGLIVGQIGYPGPAVFENSASGGGYLLHGTAAYSLTTSTCPTKTNNPGDSGNFCLELGNATGCTEPVLLSPATLVFPAQAIGSSPTSQQITLTNTDPSGSTLNGLTLSFAPQAIVTNPFAYFPPGSPTPGPTYSDFNGLANFAEQDTCASSQGAPFSLASGHSCTITISFLPQESCPWVPVASSGNEGEPPSLCPNHQYAELTVNSPKSADSEKAFSVLISGTGLSALVPSVPEIDFGSEAQSETSPPQQLTFSNQGVAPVQILPALSQSPCPPSNSKEPFILSRPLTSGVASDFQVAWGNIAPAGASPYLNTVGYTCDLDPGSLKPNFQITEDSCSGNLIAPLGFCSLSVSFAPQPQTATASGLDYFLELNTLQCTSNVTADCEIDSGRFPVELKANPASPLRMTPGAGLDFGIQPMNQTTNPLNITLYNDPKDPNSQTINFTGNVVNGDYAETDDCGSSLAPGNSCTMMVTFKPKIVGFDPGFISITYTVSQVQTIYLRGTGH